MNHEQMSLFLENEVGQTKTREAGKETPATSVRMLEGFVVADIPFIGCDFDTLYPHVAHLVPKESILFDGWGLETAIACEVVCAAICHQMNWDYLRNTVFEKTLSDREWLSPQSLSHISVESVKLLFEEYDKPDRIRADERAGILRQIGELAAKFGCFTNILFDENGIPLPEPQIKDNLFLCPVFSKDPEEKKLQLLLQKLSNYSPLVELALYCKPTIDYHLIRCFLRRGLISPKNKLAKDFISDSNDTRIERKESTVAALRKVCSILVQRISDYTNLSISTVNQIEWYVGRSICTEGTPDCYLKQIDAEWIRSEFDRCPFYQNCCAINHNPSLLHIEEPLYKGTSY